MKGENSMRFHIPRWLAGGIAALAMTAIGTAAFAAADPPPRPAPAPDKCSKFKKDSPEWKRCKAGTSRSDEDRYELGHSQAMTGDYAAAIETLKAVGDQRDARVLTLIGFATRKLGRVEEALGYYNLALSINPNLTSTRQYLGEAYLQKNQPEKAKEQLAEISKRCGVGCEDYTKLAEEIAKFEKSRS
ncbi:MAG: tetratricopeptide repeat protein [Hyphomicrobiaceae bacterium]|nr:MAG: tetratricopeptide repeat protein [Hyphomicrobiaceae bacterium]